MNNDILSKKLRILVVDDMRSIRQSVLAILKDIGFEDIKFASDGMQAYLKLLNAHDNGFPIELVISDVNMPKTNGLDLLKQIRGNRFLKTTKVIMLTTESESTIVLKAIHLGANSYVIKPPTLEAMLEKLYKVFSE